MNAEQLRKAHQQAPFRPFTLHISDRRQFHIRHPDFLWLVPGDRVVGIADEKGAMEIVDLIHVTSLGIDGSELLSV